MARTVVWRPGATGLPVYRGWRGIPAAGQPTAGVEDSTVNASLVVATDGEVAQAIADNYGDVEVVCDSSLAPCTMTHGVAWRSPNDGVLTVRGVKSADGATAATILTVTGAFVGPVAGLKNLDVRGVTSGTPLLSLSESGNYSGVTLKTLAASSSPMVVLANSSSTVMAADGLTLDNSAANTHPVIQVGISATAGLAAKLLVSASSSLTLTGASTIQTPNASSSLLVVTDASVPLDLVRTALSTYAGTETQVPLGTALNVDYTATTVADWSGTNPTSLASALDRIAAKITPIP